MTSKEKLIQTIRANQKAVRFDDACKVAEWLGFKRAGGKGAHVVFVRPGETIMLNFQNRDGTIPLYQARQLILMLNKYGGDHVSLSN